MDTLFRPRSVVVVGASADESKLSGKVLPALRRGGYEGRVAAVNPSRNSLDGVPCFPSVEAVEGDVDLACVIVPLRFLEDALESCARKGVGSVIVYTGGFGEVGDEGRQRERFLREFVERTGIRLLGPNCQGVFVPSSRLCTTFNGVLARPDNRTPGHVAWISQSGAVGGIAVGLLRRYGLGVRLWVSTGNEADLDFAAIAEHALDDPGTHVVCGYLESIKDVPAFRRLAGRALGLGKPIVLIKGGASASGQAAAQSHTGAIVGDHRMYAGLFAHAGVLAVRDLEELAATAALFAAVPEPRPGGSVGILGNSGGTGVILADLCEQRGLRVPSPDPATVERLGKLLPEFIRPSNPVDIPMQVRYDPTVLSSCIEALDGAEGGGPDAHIVCLHSIFAEDGYDVEGIARALRAARDATGAGVLLVPYSCGPELDRAAAEAGVATFPDGPRAVAALSEAVRWAALRQVRAAEPATLPVAAVEAVPAPEGSARRLTEHEAKDLLRAEGLPVVEGALARTAEEAVAAAERFGYPVAAKLASPGVAHKTDVGALRLGLADATAVARAHRQLHALASEVDPTVTPEVAVERMAPPGDDVVVALRREATFGLTVMLGIGGVQVEALDDVATRPAPVTAYDIREMIGELKLGAVLSSERGRSGSADVGWLAGFVASLQRFVAARPWIEELELNPVRLYPAGKGGVVLDALLVRQT